MKFIEHKQHVLNEYRKWAAKHGIPEEKDSIEFGHFEYEFMWGNEDPNPIGNTEFKDVQSPLFTPEVAKYLKETLEQIIE